MNELLPKAAELTARLEEARATRARLDRLIAWLEEGLDLADWSEHDHEARPEPGPDDAAVPERERGTSLLPPVAEPDESSDSSTSDEATKPEPAPVPHRRAEQPVRAGARDIEGKILSTIISANQPLSRAQIVERAGLRVEQIKKPLQRLVADGKVTAEGATKSRRYRAAEHQWHSQKRAAIEAGTKRSARKLDSAVGRVGLRDRVMKAVSADPCALDNNRLALALDADLDDVADACQFLIDKGRLQMHEDGTYLRSVAEAAREVAAA